MPHTEKPPKMQEILSEKLAQSQSNSVDDLAKLSEVVDKGLHRQTWERQIGVRLIDDLMHMDKLRQQAQLVRRLVRKTQNGTVGQDTDEPEDNDDDMASYHVGDISVIVGDQDKPQQAPAKKRAAQPPPVQKPAPTQPNKWLPRALMGTALAATGLGGALVGHLMTPTPDDRDTWSIVVPLKDEPNGSNRVQ